MLLPLPAEETADRCDELVIEAEDDSQCTAADARNEITRADDQPPPYVSPFYHDIVLL